MYKDLTGKTAIVTGSSKGIGKAIAERFGQERMNVVVNYHSDPSGADETLEIIKQNGGKPSQLRRTCQKKRGFRRSWTQL